MAALTMQVTLAPGPDVSDRDQQFEPSPDVQVFDQQGRRERGSEAGSVKVRGIDGPNKDSAASVIARTGPLVSRKIATDGTRPILSKKPNVLSPFRFNTTRLAPGARKVGPGPLKKPPVGAKKKAPIVPKKPKPGVPTIGNRTMALTLREPSVEASSTERRDAKNPAIRSGTDSDTNRQSRPEEPTTAVGSKEQPDVDMAASGNDTAPVSSEPTGSLQSQEKKCVNKIKVTHIRLPQKKRGCGFRGDGTVLAGKKPGSHQGSSETDDTPDLKPSSAETDLDYSPDPFQKLLTDTFDSLNITTFSLHLSQPSDLSADSERVREQILSVLRPSSSFSSSTLSTSQSSSHSSASSSSSSLSSSSSPSLVLPPSTAAPSTSLTYLVLSSPSSPPSLSPSPPSSYLSNSDKSGSVGSNEPDVDSSKTSPGDRKLPPSGKGGVLFRRTPVKSGYVRRPRPNFGLFQNKTHLNFRAPQHSSPHLNLIPGREAETRDTSTRELLSSSSASDESPAVEANVPVRDKSGYNNGASTPASSEVEQNEKKMQTERGRIPVRHLPLKRGYLRRPIPNFGPLQNRTRPYLRLLPAPLKSLNPASETRNEQVSSTELPASSSPPLPQESYLVEGTGPREENEDIVRTGVSTEFRQTHRGNRVLSSNQPTIKVGYFRQPQLYGGRFQNKTHTNLKPPQHPHGGYVRKPFPTRRLNGGSSITVRSQTSHLEKVSTSEIQDNQSGEQNAPLPTQGVQNRQSGEQDTAEVIPSAQMEGHDSSIRPQTNKLEGEDNVPVQITKSGEEVSQTPDSKSDFDSHKERVNAGKNTGGTSRGRPTTKQTSSDARHGAPRPITLPKRQPPTRSTQMSHYISGSPRREDKKTNNTAKRLFDSKTEQTRSAYSKPLMGSDVSSSGVTRELLDNVGVTNRSSDGFTLTWDSPEGKYKNFVVTRKEVGKDEGPKQEESQKDREEAQEASRQPTKDAESEYRSSEDGNRVSESVFTQVRMIPGNTTAKPATGSDKTFKKVLPGSARSFQFENLPPQTEYTVTLLGKGPGLLSRLHKLVISTGTSHCDSRTTSITTVQCYNITVNVVKYIFTSCIFTAPRFLC